MLPRGAQQTLVLEGTQRPVEHARIVTSQPERLQPLEQLVAV